MTLKPDCLRRAEEGWGECDVLLIHKDLGYHEQESNLGISADKIIEMAHRDAPYVRVGVVSGEYPDGSDHVLKMGADFYLSPLHTNDEWCIAQMRRGVVSEVEQQYRGRIAEKPPAETHHYGVERG